MNHQGALTITYDLDTTTPSHMSRYLPLICLALMHTLVDACAMLVEPLWPALETEFKLAGVLALSTAFIVQSLPTSLSQAVFGYVRDRRRAAWLLLAGPIVGAVAMSLLGAASNRWALGALLIVGGAGIGAFHPEAAVAAGRALPGKRTQALSIFMLGGALGLGLGPTISGAVVTAWGFHALVWLAPVLLLVVFGLWFVGRIGNLSPQVERTHTADEPFRAFDGRGLLALWIFLICSLRLVPNMAMGKVLAFMLDRRGGNQLEIGLYQSLFLAAASAGMIAMAFRFRTGTERKFLIWCPLAGIPLLCVLGVEGLPDAALVATLIAAGLVLWGTTPAMVSYAQQQFPRGAGMASAITMGLAWGLGGLIQAPITASFAEMGRPHLAFYAFIPCLLLASLGAWRLPALDSEGVETPTDDLVEFVKAGVEPGV